MALAAERLGTTKSDLIASICSDPQGLTVLSQQLRTMTLVNTFEMLRETQLVYQASLPELDPADLAKTVVALATLVQSMTASTATTTNVNMTEVVLKMLPPEARRALMTLAQDDGPRSTTAGHDVHTVIEDVTAG